MGVVRIWLRSRQARCVLAGLSRRYVEPSQIVDAVCGHRAWFQTEGLAVEGGGVGKSAGWDEQVDVGYAGDHFCWERWVIFEIKGCFCLRMMGYCYLDNEMGECVCVWQ
jgi:hypothetical protein